MHCQRRENLAGIVLPLLIAAQAAAGDRIGHIEFFGCQGIDTVKIPGAHKE
jgi:hypothetical protein